MQAEVNIDIEPTKDITPYQEKNIPTSFNQGKKIHRFNHSCSYLFKDITRYKIYLFIIISC